LWRGCGIGQFTTISDLVLIGGPDPESRRVLATSTSMRSVVVVLYVARYCFPGTDIYMVPIVYLSHDPHKHGFQSGVRRMAQAAAEGYLCPSPRKGLIDSFEG
jgi:hypothetical protein